MWREVNLVIPHVGGFVKLSMAVLGLEGREISTKDSKRVEALPIATSRCIEIRNGLDELAASSVNQDPTRAA